MLVALTAKGRKAMRAHDAFHKKMVESALADLTPEEMCIRDSAQAGRVGLAGFIDLAVANCANMETTLEGFGVAQAPQGCVVGNPPYGVRLMARDLDVFYGALQKLSLIHI